MGVVGEVCELGMWVSVGEVVGSSMWVLLKCVGKACG